MFRAPDFLDQDTCRRVRLAMDGGRADEAEVLGDRVEQREDTRRAVSIEVEDAVLEDVERRLDGMRSAVAAFFEAQLVGREGAGFLRYEPGGFYAPHRDRADVPSWPGAARRRIAVVIFLNADFEGGVLRLFLDSGTREVHPSAGALVAFPADLLHEVTPVSGGVRDVIVDWFYGNIDDFKFEPSCVLT